MGIDNRDTLLLCVTVDQVGRFARYGVFCVAKEKVTDHSAVSRGYSIVLH